MARVYIPLFLVLSAAVVVTGGCSSTPKRSSDLPDPLPSRTTHGGEPAEAQDELSRSAMNLQDGFDQMNKRSGIAGQPDDADGSKSGGQTQPKSGDSPDGLSANRSARLPDGAVDDGKPSAKEDRSKERRRRDAVTELLQQLQPGITGHLEPLRTAMPLIALDTISPGAANSEIDSVCKAISPDQRRSVMAARDLAHALATDPNLTAADPAALARSLRDRADQLAGTTASDSLALGTVALCQRVDGYGRYSPLPSCTFIAGRASAMIIYTEIENFSQARLADLPGGKAVRTPGDQWQVEVGQTVTLYFDADASEQLVFPESIARDVSASRRHDFFLVQRVDLPKNLSVGNYNLKVRVKDVPSGAIADRVIPIRIVADASAARAEQARQSYSPHATPEGASGAVAGVK